MSDTTQKKRKEQARQLAKAQQKLAEVREIEQLQTISEDETDREQ